MAHYIFLPVPTPEMEVLAQQLITTCMPTQTLTILRNPFASGKGKGFVRKIGLGCLRGLSATDTLYVFMHGAGTANSSNVGANRGHTKSHSRGQEVWTGGSAEQMKKYNMTTLANVLKGEGLPKGFVNLHLLTCGSGLAGNAGNTTDAPLAQRLRTIMAPLGYTALRVSGYRGDILVNIVRANWFSVETEDNRMVPASDVMDTFTA